jgi:hypothetical protein
MSLNSSFLADKYRSHEEICDKIRIVYSFIFNLDHIIISIFCSTKKTVSLSQALSQKYHIILSTFIKVSYNFY